MNFTILIDESFLSICTDKTLEPINNKYVISLINDFEDGQWRYNNFQNFIWDNIAETSLSVRERESLVNQSHSLLALAAKNLRLTDKEDDISQGSEISEILLYGIMRHYYNALPVVPKIFYKQNTQDNAKGADSVHIVVQGSNDFSIWFGEAKFYNSLADARLGTIVNSVEKSLQTDKLVKENCIITNVADIDLLIDNEQLRNKIKEALSTNQSIDKIKTKLHIPILLLHECELTKSQNTLTEEYKTEIIAFHKERAQAYFTKQIKKISKTIFNYSEITFHIILFPVPSKTEIIKKFVCNVEHYKNQ